MGYFQIQEYLTPKHTIYIDAQISATNNKNGENIVMWIRNIGQSTFSIKPPIKIISMNKNDKKAYTQVLNWSEIPSTRKNSDNRIVPGPALLKTNELIEARGTLNMMDKFNPKDNDVFVVFDIVNEGQYQTILNVTESYSKNNFRVNGFVHKY
ncbi:hypothetical protein [Arcobacter roscoffensis]|uniref:Copper chaperone PCu(A)C n=1 Tax=Arcobacter roscoffensis TaxID=2961520 RepID=A0ABY5E9T8_9BACT|nr:hypothetical protein [Arcobacter roscoffensis]UTJ07478.1 hypothetical protein NJU99_05120 [Arcobacter roscoffensis]